MIYPEGSKQISGHNICNKVFASVWSPGDDMKTNPFAAGYIIFTRTHDRQAARRVMVA